MNQNKRINYDSNYFREPKVIINNEKLMMDFFKKKNKLIDKLPYLSRSTNDLINYNYKKEKEEDKLNIIKNWMSSNNNYLNIIPKIKKIRLKRIHLSPNRNYINNQKDLKIKPSLSVKNLDSKSSANYRLNPYKENKTLDITEETHKSSLNSIIYANDTITQNRIREEKEKEKEKIFNERYNQLRQLSNGEVLNKIGNSIELPGMDLQKGMFPGLIKRKNENNIDFLFGNHFPQIK